MFKANFSKENRNIFGREAIVVNIPGHYSLRDTMECGQCFRYELIRDDGEITEYIIPVGSVLINVGQTKPGEIIFFGLSDEDFENIARPYFTLDTDYEAICRDIIKRTDSEWLKSAAECARGIAILKQDPWETLFSFIISQNNNIPRIRKIIREISSAYGVNISLQNRAAKCPANKIDGTPCEEKCKKCGICYTFPTCADVIKNPEAMLPSHPGFRYRYLLDAAEKVHTGAVDLEKIANAASYDVTLENLMQIIGVGEKVAACCALFGFANLEAFPIDVWMKRAINDYFDGKLDPKDLGPYAGVAQQYIFHYIRNIESKQK